MGDLQKSHWINALILNARKIIFNAKIDMSTPSKECVKRNVKLLFHYERLTFRLRGREDNFEKRWELMIE